MPLTPKTLVNGSRRLTTKRTEDFLFLYHHGIVFCQPGFTISKRCLRTFQFCPAIPPTALLPHRFRPSISVPWLFALAPYNCLSSLPKTQLKHIPISKIFSGFRSPRSPSAGTIALCAGCQQLSGYELVHSVVL